MRRKAKRGSAMVELSLVGSLFFALLMGVMDMGQFLFLQQAMVERVRSAARWGAVTDATNAPAIRNMVLYMSPGAPVGATPSFGLTAAMVDVSTAGAGTDDYRLTLTVSGYSYNLLTPYLAGSYRGAPLVVSVPLGRYY